jgi:hypothetical protein
MKVNDLRAAGGGPVPLSDPSIQPHDLVLKDDIVCIVVTVTPDGRYDYRGVRKALIGVSERVTFSHVADAMIQVRKLSADIVIKKEGAVRVIDERKPKKLYHTDASLRPFEVVADEKGRLCVIVPCDASGRVQHGGPCRALMMLDGSDMYPVGTAGILVTQLDCELTVRGEA